MIKQKSMKIAIASGKGGTGKTTLSVNLASYIADYEEVVLVDLDVEEPNSGLFIKAEPGHSENIYKRIPEWNASKCTHCGICQKVCNFHAVLRLGPSVLVFPELCHSCFACSELCPADALPMVQRKTGILNNNSIGDLHFVEGRLDVGEEQAVPLISSTKKYTEKKYGHLPVTVFDSPPGTSCSVMEAVKGVDFVILVTEPTPFGLHDLKLAAETMRELKLPFGVVINRDGSENHDVVSYCESEKIPVLAKIANNRRIAELYSSGNLVYRKVPEFRAALVGILDHCLKTVDGGVE